MPAPFYLAIKGTTAGAPGSSAFTPNAAAAGFRAWSNVPTGWIGLVRFDDGTAWEIRYSYWNGTTLSRANNTLVASSTGSSLVLTSAATAAHIVDPMELQPHMGGSANRGGFANGQSGAFSLIGVITLSVLGTAVGQLPIAGGNYYTEQLKSQTTSATTTANSQAGWHTSATGTVFVAALMSATAGRAGFEVTFRFGAPQLSVGQRLFAGVSSVTYVAATVEPSLFVSNLAIFGRDSADTNIQFMTNNASASANKIDTGIPFVANGWYEATIWAEPGSSTVFGLLVRIDTGDIWFGSSSTKPPLANPMYFYIIAALDGTNVGTAPQIGMQQFVSRIGS